MVVENKIKYTAYDHFNGNRMHGNSPESKTQSKCPDLPQNYFTI